ncbi:hypothetical protein LTR24_002611 [Lithohypha guttulata]|uniref:Major facilitator superfamily (MFS) profile domain-containing protein n=1 Tax=Lithohypha guttulata TaxID=1690604 RepID=A0ABR0KJ18_9EURO|nr:hypothetical protein LTR24_002611 [Lithohypha guttulata]
MATNNEKGIGQQFDDPGSPIRQDVQQTPVVPDLDESHRKKILWKMDLRIIPMVTTLYLLSFLDRGNIGNARVLGMAEDINLAANEYNIALMVFFFPYALLEVPANILLKKLRPSYPGCAFYLTLWYAPQDLAFRQGMFFSAASAAGAFSGLLAYGIDHMDGTANLAGWRWIFILEGLITCLVGLAAFFWIHDSPKTAKFLDPTEKAWARNRLMRKTASGRLIEETESLQWKYIVQGLTDWQIYLAVFINWATACSIYGMSFFLPQIVRQLGYTGQQANLLTIPVYVTAAILTVLLCWLSDRVKKRSIFVMCLLGGMLFGFIFAISGSASGNVPGLVYAGCFISTACCYPAYVLTISWILPNVAPTYKRAVASAVLIGVGNLGGVFASNFYRSEDAPEYLLGHGMEIMMICIGFIALNVLRFLYTKENKARLHRQEAVANMTEEELADMGDRSPTFRYQL